jgi:hypothetical protein
LISTPVFCAIAGTRYVFQNAWKFAPDTVSTIASVSAARAGRDASGPAAALLLYWRA